MASKISKETTAIQRGAGEKVGNVLMSSCSFLFGFLFAFYWGWLMTLILLAGFPIMSLMGVGMAVAMTDGLRETMRAYSQSSGYAEQALSAIKVVQTYGQERLEMTNYNKYLSRAKVIGKQIVFRRALGGSVLFMIIFGFYAYSFFFGGYLRYNDIKNGEQEYTGGVVLAIMFSVVFGAFGLGGSGPHIASIAEGRIAGKIAFDVIDHQPKINAFE